METVTANQIKTRGVSILEDKLAQVPELVITVRGRERFVVMDIENYNYLRECELAAALREVRADYQTGKYVSESVDEHLEKLAQ
jgi:PHD/YefM family antitoxin component YafN of YafNO toxin-antitoxin module